MKLHLFSNDKSTAKDELIVTLFALCNFIIGIILIILKPSFWIISSENFICTGVIMIAISVILAPSIIWRLSTNYDKYRTNKNNSNTQNS